MYCIFGIRLNKICRLFGWFVLFGIKLGVVMLYLIWSWYGILFVVKWMLINGDECGICGGKSD